MKRLEREFYKKSSIQLAQDLIGKILVRNINGQKISGRIVEVEAYMGIEDKAAHSYAGKLCMAMKIDKSSNGVDLCKDNFFIESDEYKAEIISSKRIGIDYAEEAAGFPWRFYIKDNRFVSKI